MNYRALAGAIVLILFSGTASLADNMFNTLPVSGEGTHYFTTAIVHSAEPTDTGILQRSSETIELQGDLVGRILYHPISVFDFVAGTLVNTGHQVFSGTILGSDPVFLHDDDFRFDVNLATGATVGKVFLVDRIDGPNVKCRLDVVGTGTDTDGNANFVYSGECKIKDVSTASNP